MVDKPVKDDQVEEPKAEAPAAPAGSDQQGRELYDVTCSSCGKPAQVPFKPSGDRPVYCRDCYMKQKGRG